MSLVVNTNVASMNAQRSLMASGRELQTAMERLSTGKKINSAADDAAGFAIAESMTAQIRGLSMAAKNASDALGLLKVVENATNDVTDMLQRIRELAVQAQSGTNSTGDVANLQQEANALIDEINRVSEDTTYNGVAYIGSEKGTKNIQVGYNDGDSISISTYDIGAQNLGIKVDDVSTPAADDTVLVALKDAAGNYLNIAQTAQAADTSDATQANHVDRRPGALEVITGAIDQLASYKAEWGAGQNRLEYTVSNLMNVVEFTTAARSRIQDADFAVEAARLAKAQVLQQTGTAMLAQANASPQLAISLLS
ncbi:MAG: flagellin FliC [Gammaproteobacteria bacterium]|nr:flagellin FliC [Gammaproteobacteria bacterium]